MQKFFDSASDEPKFDQDSPYDSRSSNNLDSDSGHSRDSDLECEHIKDKIFPTKPEGMAESIFRLNKENLAIYRWFSRIL